MAMMPLSWYSKGFASLIGCRGDDVVGTMMAGLLRHGGQLRQRVTFRGFEVREISKGVNVGKAGNTQVRLHVYPSAAACLYPKRSRKAGCLEPSSPDHEPSRSHGSVSEYNAGPVTSRTEAPSRNSTPLLLKYFRSLFL
jgi:hypothetical protein